jgi:hypothetical protein
MLMEDLLNKLIYINKLSVFNMNDNYIYYLLKKMIKNISVYFYNNNLNLISINK